VQRSFRQSVQGFFGGRCEKASVVRAMKLSEIPMRVAVSRIDADHAGDTEADHSLVVGDTIGQPSVSSPPTEGSVAPSARRSVGLSLGPLFPARNE